jgi:hypothetical protein
MATPAARRFSKPLVEALDAAKIIGVRAGPDHRFTGVWPVVVDGRLFARSWGSKATGWFQAFLDEPDGVVQVGGREIPVRGRRVRGERLLDAMERAYAEKFNTPASRKWVTGFARPARRANSLEFVPR